LDRDFLPDGRRSPGPWWSTTFRPPAIQRSFPPCSFRSSALDLFTQPPRLPSIVVRVACSVASPPDRTAALLPRVVSITEVEELFRHNVFRCCFRPCCPLRWEAGPRWGGRVRRPDRSGADRLAHGQPRPVVMYQETTLRQSLRGWEAVACRQRGRSGRTAVPKVQPGRPRPYHLPAA